MNKIGDFLLLMNPMPAIMIERLRHSVKQIPRPTEHPLTYVRTEETNPGNKHASYVRIVYKDSTGKEWYYTASSFWFDLQPVEESSMEGELI